ncbi:MAG: FadR family transcriptional regulator [Rhizobiaceae bacterium]|nr:FadR family transcriptional regulator [Rhizobiaceae bacterium]
MTEHLIRAPSLADTVANLLRREISHGRYKPAEKLPTEHKLSEMYGVSRAIIREALGRLKQDGLVRSRQGAGAYVAEDGSPIFRLIVGDGQDMSEVQHVVELLVAFEAAASGLAAIRRTNEQLTAIRAQFDAMERAIEAGESGIDEDVAFHRAIIQATGNPVFQDMFNFLSTRVRTFIGIARTNSARYQGVTKKVQEEHSAILEAIVEGSEEKARAAAALHLHNAARRLSGQAS